jgi:hypothetical protein
LTARIEARVDAPGNFGDEPKENRNARRFAANVRPIIDEIVRAGATSHNAIAAKLNSAMFARHGVAYGPMYRLEQSCTLSAAQAAPTHDGYKGSAVNLSIGRLCYVR